MTHPVMDIGLMALVIALGLAFSTWLGDRNLTLPLVFGAAGLILGPRGFDIIHIEPDQHLVLLVTELTLGLLLFAEAAKLGLRPFLAGRGLEFRLLTVGLVLTVLLGTALAGLILPSVTVGMAILIGAALAPTDASLGSAISSSPSIPARIRETLSVESGLNDGVVSPIVTLAIALVISEGSSGADGWFLDAIRQSAIAIAVGVAIGTLGGWLLRNARARGWTVLEHERIVFCALAVAAFAAARNLEGNGFISAFVGGLVCGSIIGNAAGESSELTATVGEGLSYAIWLVFGATMVPLALENYFSWQAVAYALVSLTVVRMLPVWISLSGAGLRTDTRLLMGWFGPRGLSSVVFLLMAFGALEESGQPVDVLVAVITMTVIASVVLHGMSATTLANWYGQQLAGASRSIPEFTQGEDPTQRSQGVV